MKRAKYRASGSCLAASHRVDGSEDRQCQAELAILGQRVGIDYARATFVLASSFLKTADLTRSPCPLDAGGSSWCKLVTSGRSERPSKYAPRSIDREWA